MGRIDLGEQRIRDPRRLGRRARRAKIQDRVGAVVATLEAAADGSQRATFDRQARQRVGLDARPRRTHLEPTQLAVGVAVEIEGDVEIAKRDVPAHVELARRWGDLQVGIARLVRARETGGEQQRESDDGAQRTVPTPA